LLNNSETMFHQAIGRIRMKSKLFFILIVFVVFLNACGGDNPPSGPVANPNPIDLPVSYYTDIIIPEVYIGDGGGLSYPPSSGSVYYYNDIHSKAESDIQLDDHIKYMQTANRYIYVSGIAIPDDSGYTDRWYHSVFFRVAQTDLGYTNYFTFPVDFQNKFSGYLYFRANGTNRIYAYRVPDYGLYPRPSVTRGVDHTVSQYAPTLVFYVNVSNAVPSGQQYLLPTYEVDCGTKAIRDYAQTITTGASTDVEKLDTIFTFLVNGDTNGAFTYNYYDEIYPGYLDVSWNSIFIASHFLSRRKGVCNDFAELFAAMARSLGFQVKRVSGSKPSGGGHMWNIVYVDGGWKRVDATWANSNPSNYKKYAEFYPEFDGTYFITSHENTYTEGFTEKY